MDLGEPGRIRERDESSEQVAKQRSQPDSGADFRSASITGRSRLEAALTMLSRLAVMNPAKNDPSTMSPLRVHQSAGSTGCVRVNDRSCPTMIGTSAHVAATTMAIAIP